MLRTFLPAQPITLSFSAAPRLVTFSFKRRDDRRTNERRLPRTETKRKRHEMMMRSSANRSGALRLLAFVALASLGRVAMAQDICACKGACEFVLGNNICYVAGGVSCERATRTLFPPWTDAWIPCPDSSGGPGVSGPPVGSANSVPGRPATSIPGGSADGRDCKGNFGPEKCVAARNPSFPGEKVSSSLRSALTFRLTD